MERSPMQKTFIGTQLRQLRREKGQTQVEMGRVLGVSAAYINLLEKNQRSFVGFFPEG